MLIYVNIYIPLIDLSISLRFSRDDDPMKLIRLLQEMVLHPRLKTPKSGLQTNSSYSYLHQKSAASACPMRKD